MAKVNSFEELEVWRKTVDLCELIYIQANNSLLNKDLTLRDQLRKSSISIPSNIAKGSCGELRTQLFLMHKIGYLNGETFELLRDKCRVISKQLGNFIKYLRSTRQNPSKPSTFTPSKLSKPSTH